MDEDNIRCGKLDSIVPTSELPINFRINNVRTRKSCFVYLEKLDQKGIIQLRLTEKCDQRKMYLTTIDNASFAELKQEQSLHVTFIGFIDNLMRIMQDCLSGKLEIIVIQQTNTNVSFDPAVGLHFNNTLPEAVSYQLQFVELRPFKNLVHLCLPCRVAPLNMVLFYMNINIDSMQQKFAIQEQATQQVQQELHAHLSRIDHLEKENARLKDDIVENNRNLSQRHIEEMQQMQESLRKSTEQRHNDNERNRKTISTLQTQIEKLTADKSSLQDDIREHQKRLDCINEELNHTKSHACYLKDQNDKFVSEINALKNSELKSEMYLNDARKRIVELEEKIVKYEKNKADLIAELEAEKKILQTKRQALEMTTEEISKANEIIFKQSQKLSKLKKTISWRTEVALEQEKAIREMDEILELRDSEVKFLNQTVDSLREEIPRSLDALREFSDSLETKYKDEIKALHEKVEMLANLKVPIREREKKVVTDY